MNERGGLVGATGAQQVGNFPLGEFDSFGVQPRLRILVVSRKMNGESPTQPRSPPLYERRGEMPRCSVIQPTESFTSQY